MTYDQTFDGAGNGTGGRFNDSTAGILKRQADQVAAEAKAAATPHSLTEEDIPNLSGSTISDLMAKGQLGHLGLGARRHPARRHR